MRSLLAPVLLSIASSMLLLPGPLAAESSEMVIVEPSPGSLDFTLSNPRMPYAGARLIVTGPDGYSLVKEFEPRQQIFFSPARDGAPGDGQFNYELRLLAIETPRAGMGMPEAEATPLSSSRGAFSLDKGMLIIDRNEDGTDAVVVPDDQVIQGSLCVGLDCTPSETFSDFSVLTIKENNTRIRFWDTSNSGSFPSTDWELRANDTSNGGANQFSIVDYTAGREILTVEAGAPASTLFLDDQGRAGFGTNTPLLNLHVVDTNTPAVRLDQDGTGGFAAQSWDMGGNEVEFFVRDATSLTIPFSIVQGAPTDALVVDGGGRVGLGVLSPMADLHIHGSGSDARLRLESTAGSWETIAGDQGFSIDRSGNPAPAFQLSNEGDLSVSGSMISRADVSLPAVDPSRGTSALAEIEAHIERFGQLPGISNPGAEGHDLVEFQMQLLEAIQQLTIQNIEQQKEIEALRSQIGRMRR